MPVGQELVEIAPFRPGGPKPLRRGPAQMTLTVTAVTTQLCLLGAMFLSDGYS